MMRLRETFTMMVFLAMPAAAFAESAAQSPSTTVPATTTGTADGAGSGSAQPPDAPPIPTPASSRVASIPDLDELRPPTSPAFSLLGVSPTEIDRPTTPSALAAAIGTVSGSSVPAALALEFSPYWLFQHDQLDMKHFSDDYISQILSSISVNLASNHVAADPVAGATEFTDLSAGLYSILYREFSPRDCHTADGPSQTEEPTQPIEVLFSEASHATDEQCTGSDKATCEQKVFDIFQRRSADFHVAVKTFENATTPNSARTEAQLQSDPQYIKIAGYIKDAYSEALSVCHDQDCKSFEKGHFVAANIALTSLFLGPASQISATWSKKLADCRKTFWVPEGPVVNLAFATAWRFADNKWNNGAFLRSALWVSGGYEGKHFSYLALARTQWERTGNNGLEPDFIDAGGRLIYHDQSYAASVEGVRRFSLTDELKSGFRLAVIGEAKIGAQWLTLSVGKDYDSTQNGSFFAIANFTVTVGDPSLKPSPASGS